MWNLKGIAVPIGFATSSLAYQGASKKTPGKRRPWNRSNPEILRKGSIVKSRIGKTHIPTHLQGWEDFPLFFPVEKIVMVLHRYERSELVIDSII